MLRRARALRVTGVMALLLLATAGVLAFFGIYWIASLMILMIAVLLWDAKKSLPELEGERMVLESSSRFRHVVEYGVIALGFGLAFAIEEAVRRSGVDPPWQFGWGTTFFVALPAVLLAFNFLVPRISAWIGIGTKARRDPPPDPPQESSSSS